jgi:HK97 family phage prohead protease
VNVIIERAAWTCRPEDIAAKLRNAPAWVLNRATPAQPAPKPAAPAKPTARAKAPVIGWVAGVCCPGVSRPAFTVSDGERLPEQFTPRAIEMILAQVRGGAVVPLTWNHDGPEIASSRSLDLLFRVDGITGLEFEARLRDTKLGREVLAEIEGRSLGVSIGFDKTKSWIVDRDGVGRMRVVDECRLHHVAVLPRTATLRPAYSGARCYGAKSTSVGCPVDLRTSARAWAFRFIAAQAGVRA